MDKITYRNRRCARIENETVRVTVTEEGGHVAEILHKASGVKPLWTPHWPSIEPSTYHHETHPEYGPGHDAQLLCGILGHNLCLDTFGEPSPEEVAAGIPVHGEASVGSYEIAGEPAVLTMETVLAKAQLRFHRRIRLSGSVIGFSETVENLSSSDRPIAWTQHVTLGPPFLERGVTQFRATAADFENFRTFTSEPASGGYTPHLTDSGREHAWFLSWSPKTEIACGYVWKREDFPWLGRWEENHSRTAPPWNGQALTCGMEFGVSPYPESRRKMVTRGSMLGTPAFRWIAAKARLHVEYCAFITAAKSIPESVTWDGNDSVNLE